MKLYRDPQDPPKLGPDSCSTCLNYSVSLLGYPVLLLVF